MLERTAISCSSAGHVQDGIGVLTPPIEDGDGSFGRQAQELHLAKLGLLSHFGHHWQPAFGSGSDHQPAAAPRDVFFGRERCMAVDVPILLGGLLLSLPNLAPVDDQIVLIGHAVDPDGAEGETLEVHRYFPAWGYAPHTRSAPEYVSRIVSPTSCRHGSAPRPRGPGGRPRPLSMQPVAGGVLRAWSVCLGQFAARLHDARSPSPRKGPSG